MKLVLETTRLLLREMTDGDAADILALAQDPEVGRYLPGESPLTTLAQALDVLRERIYPQYPHQLGRWACLVKSSGDFIGWSGVKHVPEDGEYDLGYRLLRRHWGQGYATEAAQAVVGYARGRLAGQRVVGKAMLENRASRRVLEKIGLVYEGEVADPAGALAVYVMK